MNSLQLSLHGPYRSRWTGKLQDHLNSGTDLDLTVGKHGSHQSRIENTFVGAQRWKAWQNNLAYKHIRVSHVNRHKTLDGVCFVTTTDLPEVVHFSINQWLVLPLDVVDVFDVTGVQMLLNHEAQETVIGSVSCGGGNRTTNQKRDNYIIMNKTNAKLNNTQ